MSVLMQKEVKDAKTKEAELKVEAAIGFRHVIDLLSSEKKLIVGHNCFLGIISQRSLNTFISLLFINQIYSLIFLLIQMLHTYTANF